MSIYNWNSIIFIRIVYLFFIDKDIISCNELILFFFDKIGKYIF